MKKTFETLYARDSKGKVLQWDSEVINNNGQIDIKISYGEFDGNKTLTWQRNIEGKNIGKANETNPWQQAILQVESRRNRLIKKGYMTFDSLNLDTAFPSDSNKLLLLLDTNLPKYRTDASGNIKPMKAQPYFRKGKEFIDPNNNVWDDKSHYFLTNYNAPATSKDIITKFPCMAQPKINGVRALIRFENNTVHITSKEGLDYKLPHITDYLKENCDIFSYEDIDLVLDGELYVHGTLLQDIASAVKKPNLLTSSIKFVLFDLAIEEKTNIERWNIIKTHIKPILDLSLNCPIEIIRTVNINNNSDAQIITDKFIEQGYEGSIFRSYTAVYGFGKRPQTMTKLKRVIDEEFTIIDVYPQDKDNTKGNFVCITSKGDTFEVNPKGDEAYKREVLRNKSKYIGKKLTCVFYEYTKDDKPFHIINNIVRDYE